VLTLASPRGGGGPVLPWRRPPSWACMGRIPRRSSRSPFGRRLPCVNGRWLRKEWRR